jgi:hypothetical protein
MTNILSAFSAKMHHWYQFTKFCFSEHGAQIKEARKLTKIGMTILKFLPQSTREDLMIEHLEPFVSHILGIYYAAVGHHDSIQALTLSGHSLNSMILLRSQLETVLTFFYVTEPQTDLKEVYKRTDRYRDWVVVKMKYNMDRSLKFDLVEALLPDDFKSTIQENYEIIKSKYLDSASNFTKLENSHNFLTEVQREALAKTFHIEALYHHIYAESSASIHFADIGDRMQETEPLGYSYAIRYKHGAFWPVMLSNLLQFNCIKQFGVFFGIESFLTPRLQAVFIKTAPENPVLWTGMKGASAKGRKNVI